MTPLPHRQVQPRGETTDLPFSVERVASLKGQVEIDVVEPQDAVEQSSYPWRVLRSTSILARGDIVLLTLS